ncbi:hypothetical protein ACOSQ4_006343 [Xanthoceras sorbifolium]
MTSRYPCRNKCSLYGQRACLAHDRLWEYVSNEKLTRQQCFLLIAALSFSSSFSISSFLSHFLSLSRNQSPVQAPPVFFDRFFDIFHAYSGEVVVILLHLVSFSCFCNI